jgi:hypothetical protein
VAAKFVDMVRIDGSWKIPACSSHLPINADAINPPIATSNADLALFSPNAMCPAPSAVNARKADSRDGATSAGNLEKLNVSSVTVNPASERRRAQSARA